jgi:hypothetical protein
VAELAVDVDGDVEARRAHGRDQLVEPREPRLRLSRALRLARAHHPEQQPQLSERLAAGRLDRLERFALPGLLVAEAAADAARLQHHDADAVRDDVVQLARDPRALERHRRARRRVAIHLEPLGVGLQSGRVPGAPAQCAPERPGAEQEEVDERDVARRRVAVDRRAEREVGERDHDPGDRPAQLVVRAGRGDRDHDREEREGGIVGRVRELQREPRHEDAHHHGQRIRAPPQQHGGGHERAGEPQARGVQIAAGHIGDADGGDHERERDVDDAGCGHRATVVTGRRAVVARPADPGVGRTGDRKIASAGDDGGDDRP